MTAAALADTLRARRVGAGRWMAKCPAHQDRNPSLSIAEGQNGYILLACHAGCTVEAILYALNLTVADICGPQLHDGLKGQTFNAYGYHDSSGRLVYEALRYDSPKSFRQRRPDGNGCWIWNMNGVTRVPFNLPALLLANVVLIAEGEKDARTLQRTAADFPNEDGKRTYAATTNIGGAGKWLETYSPYLAGKLVFVFQDNDEPGRDHAQKVCASVQPHAREVRLVDLPDLPEKGDVSDYLANNAPEKLFAQMQAAPVWSASAASAVSATPEDGWPEPMSKRAFHGLAGDFLRLVLPETEGDQQALLLAFLVGFGCLVGRRPSYQVESTRHGVNLFAVIVGDTAKSRKGTATDRAMHILSLVAPAFMDTRKRSGLSSGEGLIQAVRDPREEDVPVKDGSKTQRFDRQIVDTGEPDKRLLVIESEFGSVLQQSGRDGNILSAILRDAWDGKPLRVMARSNKDACQEPHISVLGNITIEELQRLLTSNDKANGFGNRILWCCARRSKKLPHGGQPLDKEKLDALVLGLQSAVKTAQTIDRVEFDPEAYRAWEAAYDVLTEGAEGIYGSMTARAEAQVIRLATLYSLLDSSPLIRLPHLKAAQEVWGYCEDSVRCIFGDALGDETADTNLRLLRTAPGGMTQTEINRAFHSHKSSAELNRALALLQKNDKIVSVKEETGGGPAIRWKLYA
jgi:hypothetical protein